MSLGSLRRMQATMLRDEPVTAAAPPPQGLELAFVMAPRQNLFFVELVDAICAEARALGVAANVHLGNFPLPHPGLVYVLVPPHEYFQLMHGRRGPSPETLKRSIFICAEQPDTSFFDENVELAPRAGAVFDINGDAVTAFRSRGIDARRFQLGWTQGWDHLRETERDIDVLFMGCISERRSSALALYANSLWRRRTCFVLSDNSLPNWQASGSFHVDEPKWDLLRRSKVLLNVHQGESPYFEWLRIVQAMSNGAVVVSEHSLDHSPLVVGEHFLSGSVETLGLQVEMLLEDGDRWWRMQTAAYEKLRRELLLRTSVEKLLAAAAELTRVMPMPSSEDPCFHQPPPDPDRIELFQSASRPPPAAGDQDAATLRRAAKDLKLDLQDVRRSLARLERTLTEGQPPERLELVHRTPGYRAVAPRVSVLMALYNYEDHVRGALDSLLRSHEPRWELIVVDDGSTDRSADVALQWCQEHPEVAATLLRHPINRGLGEARNSALAFGRGEFCFVLDADNEIFPPCLERLIAALDADPDAAFAYGMFECFRGEQPVGLLNIFPWDPNRLRLGNYIDAMALIRTELLRERFGGYSLDRRLHGWEDYDLWCRVAELGSHGVFVPELVARYRTTEHSMLALTNMSVTDVFSLLIERYPTVMGGAALPA